MYIYALLNISKEYKYTDWYMYTNPLQYQEKKLLSISVIPYILRWQNALTKKLSIENI